jgi:hypothetical protein
VVNLVGKVVRVAAVPVVQTLFVDLIVLKQVMVESVLCGRGVKDHSRQMMGSVKK